LTSPVSPVARTLAGWTAAADARGHAEHRSSWPGEAGEPGARTLTGRTAAADAQGHAEHRLGLLFLRAGVVPGFTALDTQAEILVYAVVFGVAQDLFTRLVDTRANDLAHGAAPDDLRATGEPSTAARPDPEAAFT
jgi:hypothetical protein